MNQCYFTQESRPKDMSEMKEWLSGESVKVNYQNLNISHQKRLSIDHTGTNFVCAKNYM